MRRLVPLFLLLLAVLSAPCRPAAAEAMDEPDRMMSFADGLFDRGIYDLAAREYARLLERFPDFPKAPLARFRLGECRFLRGEYAEAVPCYREVVKKANDAELAAAARLRLGSALYFLEEYGEARKALEPLLSKDVKDHYRCGASYFLGRIAAASGDDAKAAELFEHACEAGDYRAPAAYSRAKLAVRAGDARAARRYFEMALDLSRGAPLHDYAALAFASFLAKQGDTAEAERLLRPLAARGTEFPACAAALNLSAALLEAGRAKEALQAAEDALKRFPSAALAGKLSLAAAQAAAACGDHRRAASLFEDAAATLPPSPERAAAVRGLLRSLLALKEYARAAAFAKELTPLPKGDYESWSIVAESLEKLGKDAEALAVYDALEPSGPEPLLRFCRFRRALLLARLDRKDELVRAARRFAASYRGGKEAAVLLCRAGDCLLKHGDAKEAAGLFTEALDAATDRGVECYALYRRAVALHSLGEADRMAADLRSLLDRPEAAPFLDGVLMLLGDYEQARENYARAAAYYARVVDEFPRSSHVVAARIGLAACFYARGMYDRAARAYLALVEDGRAAALEAEVILWTALRLREKGDYAGALRLCEAASAQRRSDASLVEELAFIRATVFEAKGDVKAAADAYRSFLADYPASTRRFGARLGLARCLNASGAAAEARRILVRLTGETVGQLKSMAFLELARIEQKAGESEAALKHYLMVAILENDEKLAAPALLGAAECSLALGRRKEALEHAAELVKRFPRSHLRRKAERIIERLRRPALRTP